MSKPVLEVLATDSDLARRLEELATVIDRVDSDWIKSRGVGDHSESADSDIRTLEELRRRRRSGNG